MNCLKLHSFAGDFEISGQVRTASYQPSPEGAGVLVIHGLTREEAEGILTRLETGKMAATALPGGKVAKEPAAPAKAPAEEAAPAPNKDKPKLQSVPGGAAATNGASNGATNGKAAASAPAKEPKVEKEAKEPKVEKKAEKKAAPPPPAPKASAKKEEEPDDDDEPAGGSDVDDPEELDADDAGEGADDGASAADGEVSDDLVDKLCKASRLGEIVEMLEAAGFKTRDEIAETCMSLRERVPLLKRIENLEERARRAMAQMSVGT